MPNLKFVWEFFGPDSSKLSHHHYLHLKEFLEKEDIKYSGEATAFSIPNRLIVYFQNISKKITKKRLLTQKLERKESEIEKKFTKIFLKK